MTFYDVFCGIGGFRLGLERAGFKCVGSCEIDDYARRVYHKNFGEWPDRDVREVESINGAEMLCGGFPCQDISVAGKGAGLSGDRSGLWWELARIIEVCSPRVVFLENVPALVHRGLSDVIGFFADSGYDAEWDCLPAAAFGAPHRRDRIWIVAYANGNRLETNPRDSILCKQTGDTRNADEFSPRSSKKMPMWNEQMPPFTHGCGVADGIPNRIHRLRCLGNAVVPQVVEWIGRRIMQDKGE